jgi:hypothetical protein
VFLRQLFLHRVTARIRVRRCLCALTKHRKQFSGDETLGMKKATRISEAATKDSVTQKKSTQDTDAQMKTPVDVAEAREKVASLVTASASEIASSVIEKAIAGELASAKYLFEVAGLYPAQEEPPVALTEDSQAYALLRRMASPSETGICDNDHVAQETAGVSVEEAGSKT